MPLTIGRDAYEVNEALLSVDFDILVIEFLLSYTQYIHNIRSIQNKHINPY